MIGKFKKVIFVFVIMLVSWNNVHAFTRSYTDFVSGSEESGAIADIISDPIIIDYPCKPIPGAHDISCTYKYKYKYGIPLYFYITVNGYDTQNNPILENINGLEQNPILSGTAIGLSIYENKSLGYEIVDYVEGVSTDEIGLYYSVSFKYWQEKCVPPPTITDVGDNSSTTDPEPVCTLEEKRGSQSYKITDTSDGAYQAARKISIKKVVQEANGYLDFSQYSVVLPDSNDINGNEATTLDKEGACYNADRVEIDKCEFDENTTKLSDVIYRKTDFVMKKACINVKTSKVRYITSESTLQDCTIDELKIENDIVENVYNYSSKDEEAETHFHYFTPLNTKSTDKIELKIAINNYHWQNGVKVRGVKSSICKNVIKDYPNEYEQLIIKAGDGQSFIGDFDKCENLSGNPGDYDFDIACAGLSEDYNSIMYGGAGQGGCQRSVNVNLYVNQNFYNEELIDSIDANFNGFNFYYKPIDISNIITDNQIDVIFPNGVEQSWFGLGELKTITLWDDWYKAQTDTNSSTQSKAPDLSKSYETITYSAANIKLNEVRTYNKNTSYASWSKMNLDGTSQYIDSAGIITRINPTPVYKLGCGPLNINEYLLDKNGNKLLDEDGMPIENLIYRKECDNS